MSISVTCDCGKGYRVSEDKAGLRFKCRDCGTLLRVPDADGENSADETERDDDLEMEPDADYVPAHHRAAAEERSAKKNARTKKLAAKRNRWLLISGGVVASVALVWGSIALANAYLRPEQRSLLWFLIGVPAFFVLCDWLRRRSIRNTLQSYDETVQSISWRPFMNFFHANGSFPPRLYYYEVRYLDRYGNARRRSVAFIRRRRTWDGDRGGMVWDDDI